MEPENGAVLTMEETIRMAIAGDAAAFACLVERYQKMATGYAWSILGDFHLAEDAAQEAFLRAYFDLPSLREPKAFASWLRRLVFKQCDRLTRRKAHPQTRLTEDSAAAPDAAESAATNETAREVHRAMERLSEKERESVSLFYIDGYTMAEVGGFLGVPVGTVKNRLFSGRKKLKKGMVELVMDTLRSNAPGEEFKNRIAKVLDGIRSIHWSSTTPICFVGSVLACMDYLKESFSEAFLMGVSGAAFKIFWHREYSPANCDLMLLGEEPVSRTFRAVGYGYGYFKDMERKKYSQDFYKEKIKSSVDGGIPVIAIGVVGPPECCVVAGYDKGGDVLYGRSYFQENMNDYFRAENWFDNRYGSFTGGCYGIITIGKKTEPLPKREALKQALEYAVWLWRTPGFTADIVLDEGTPLSSREYAVGAAAYDGFVDALLRDSDYADATPERVKWMSYPICNDGIFLMPLKRSFAAQFLREMSCAAPGASGLILEAAGKYDLVAKEWEMAREGLPYSECPENELMRLKDPALRRRLAEHIRKAKGIEEQAVRILEEALKLL